MTECMTLFNSIIWNTFYLFMGWKMLTEIMLNRRNLLVSGAVGLGSVIAGTTVATALEPSSDLPPGMKRGKIIDYVEGAPIYEVVDEKGVAQGATFSSTELPKIHRDLQDLGKELEKSKSSNHWRGSKPVASAQGVTEVAACAAAIAWFIGGTVFPWARGAKVAYRLAKLVGKYGANTVARIIKGARGIAGSTVEKDIIALAKELSGIGGLAVCKPA